MIISFAGHSAVPSKDAVQKAVREQLLDIIGHTDHIVCYLGGYGDFDELCARVCKELKQTYTNIETVYVTPYISLSEQAKIKEMLKCGLYDATIYPSIEGTPPRFAITQRNKWMMSCADVVIAYVNRDYGGAYKSLQYAKRSKKKIINICERL